MCFMYFVVMLSNLKRSFQRRTILNHDAHRLVCLVRILGLEIIPLVMLAAEKSETSSWSWQDSYAEVDAKGDLKWKPQPFVFEKSRSIRYIEFREATTQIPAKRPRRRGSIIRGIRAQPESPPPGRVFTPTSSNVG